MSRVYRIGLLLAVVAAGLFSGRQSAQAVDDAEAASGPALYVAVLINSEQTRCYSRGRVEATRRMSRLAAEQVNRRGGVRGRPIKIEIIDNNRDEALATANLRDLMKRRRDDLLAVVGISGSNRSKHIFTEMGEEIRASGVPFITQTTVSSAYSGFTNVFSTRATQEVERVPVMADFIKANGFTSVAFVGRTKREYVTVVGDGLRAALGDRMKETGYHLVDVVGETRDSRGTLDTAQVAAALAGIKKAFEAARAAGQRPMLVVAVGSSLTPDLLANLKAAGITVPVFMVGSLTNQLVIGDPYPEPIYGVEWASVPEVQSDRLFNALSQGRPGDWLFHGLEKAPAETWKNNDCDRQFLDYVPHPLSQENLSAVRYGGVYADMIKLVAESAASPDAVRDRTSGKTAIERYRAAVIDGLGRRYTAGRGAFKGGFENWSFHADSRARAQTPFVVILPYGLGRTQLAPIQFVRLRDGSLKPIETLYLDVDVIRIHSVDNNAKSFFAEFYLAMRVSDNLSIDDISFTNAFIDARSFAAGASAGGGRQITIETVHPGGASDAYPTDMRIYKVAGRFRFTPDFSHYPFDTQQFSIDLQPRSGNKTFIIQPPPPELRDQLSAVEGWIPDQQYVSLVEDFVPVIDAFTHQPSIVPFYNARYVWQMTRETTDYYIRVIVPLAFILIVAYLSIFIPKAHLEAIVTIQVTALLSAVALYLSLPQIDTDTATTSDKIFMFDYMMVSLMIVVSILRINPAIARRPALDAGLRFAHVFLVPAVLLGLVIYVGRSELAQSLVDLSGLAVLALR